jgi:transposase-like protein
MEPKPKKPFANSSDKSIAFAGRQLRGWMIAEAPNQILRLDERHYRVASQSGDGMYDVVRTDKFAIGWNCNCLDFSYRRVKCKHIWAVGFSLVYRDKVKESVVIEPLSSNICPRCASAAIIRHGIRHNGYGDVQRLTCKACGMRFSQNFGFERMQATPDTITSAMQLYFSGESFRGIQKFLSLKGTNVSHVTVYNWICRYVELMEKYLNQLTPQVSDAWRADELFLKIKGDMKYLYAVMDNDTRFWIAQQVSDSKYTADITPLFKEGRKVTGKAPTTIITDGAFNFDSAFRKAFWRENKALAIQHIRHVRMQGDKNNNRMERLNGEIRDREKVMRSLKKADSPIISGYRIYHNYVRPHMALDGQTPAERAGITVRGKDRWLTLIQNSKKA